MEKLFIVIARINAVLLFFVLIGGGFAVALTLWETNSWRNQGGIEVPANKAKTNNSVRLNIGRVENISGTNTQMLKFCANEQSSGVFSSDGYNSEARNVLFLSGSQKTAHWLFPTHKNLILLTAQLQEGINGYDYKHPTKALFFEYVTEDTNGDGKLSHQDHIIVAITKPDGSGMTDVLQGVDKVLSYNMLDEKTLSIVYETGKFMRHARVSTVSLAKESDQEIIKLPETL